MVKVEKPIRTVRSYVRREGRITKAQRRALRELWPRYGLDLAPGPIDFAGVFGRRAPLMLEIGFGNGEALCELARSHPQNDYVGIEVYRPGIGSLLLKLETLMLRNVRVICGDAEQVFAEHIAADSLDAVYLFFPDPWPKKRHHKRRLIQPDFVTRVARSLRPDGRMHIATDWQDYAEHALAVALQTPALENTAGLHGYVSRPDVRLLTRFERRGQALGHQVWDLVFRRVG
jgi:tRNA (guanine-N7-)-methyltransferase